MRQINHLSLIFAAVSLSVLTACAWPSSSPGPNNPKSKSMNQNESGKGKLEGIVLNESRQPLAGATIVITSTTSSEPFPEIGPVSNLAGKFSFPELPVGQYTLKAMAEGYRPETRVVTVAKDQTSTVEFIMKK